MSTENDNIRLVRAVTDFLQSELSRTDLSDEDKDNLRTAIECLEIVFGLQDTGYSFRRSLLDMYSQVANPVTVKDKTSAEVSKVKGNEKMVQKKYQEAEVEYTRAIQLDKWNSVYYCNRAAARIKLGQQRAAIEDCRKALELNPDYDKAYGRMGQAYVELERPRSAVSCFQQAVRLDPECRQHRNNLEVAQRQVVERNNSGLDGIVNSLLGLFTGRESSGRGRAMSGPIMLFSDTHSSQDGPRNQPRPPSSTENPEADQDTGQEEAQTESGDDSQTIHIRMLFGIPTYSPETDDDEGQVVPCHPQHSIFSNESSINEGGSGSSSSSTTSSSDNSEYASVESDPFREIIESLAADIRNSNEQRNNSSSTEQSNSESDKKNASKDEKREPQNDK